MLVFVLRLLILLTLPFVKARPSDYVPRDDCLWSDCNVTEFMPLIENYFVDCCQLEVPLNYAKVNGTKIVISMTRLTPLNATHATRNTLFFLTGGPGSSGWTAMQYIPILFP